MYKLGKDSKLILNESKLFPWSSRISLVPFRTFRGDLIPQTSNWSGTIFGRFLQQTGSISNSSDPEFQSEKQMALANDVVQYFISLMGKKVRNVRIIRDIMYVLSFDSSIYVCHYMLRIPVTVHYFAALHLLNK